MTKLALYFHDNLEQPKIIDADCHPSDYVWAVGRSGELCQIVLKSPQVSRKHAQVRFDEEADVYQIKDWRSTNGTSLQGASLGTDWVAIDEGDKAVFGGDYWIRFSYEIDETLQERPEPTGGYSAATASAKVAPPETAWAFFHYWMSIVWVGPFESKTAQNTWQLGLAVVGVFLAIVLGPQILEFLGNWLGGG